MIFLGAAKWGMLLGLHALQGGFCNIVILIVFFYPRASHLLLLLNASVNVLIYSHLNNNFKKSLRKVCRESFKVRRIYWLFNTFYYNIFIENLETGARPSDIFWKGEDYGDRNDWINIYILTFISELGNMYLIHCNISEPILEIPFPSNQ